MSQILDLKNPPAQPPPAPVVQERVVAVPVPAPAEYDSYLDSSDQEESLAWEAHHPLSEHGRQKHYILMAGIALSGGLVSYWQASWSTMVVMLLAMAAWEVSERMAKPVAVHVDSRGLTVDGLHFPHAQLSSFDIHQMPDGTVELSLMTDRWHSRNMRLPLGTQDPFAVREFLLEHVPEDAHKVSRLDWWLRTPKK